MTEARIRPLRAFPVFFLASIKKSGIVRHKWYTTAYCLPLWQKISYMRGKANTKGKPHDQDQG
jgi:hypothetical protein